MLDLWSNSPVSERLAQDLKDWEVQNDVDWEHALLKVMAQYKPPSPQLQLSSDLPKFRFGVGDVCRFADEFGGYLIREPSSDGSQPHPKDPGLSPKDHPVSNLIATSSLASCNGRLVKHTAESRRMWTSYIMDLSRVELYGGGLEAPTFGMDITLRLASARSQDTVWCDVRRSLSSSLGTNHGEDSLSELEIIVSISITGRVQLSATLSAHWNEIIDYLSEEQRRRRSDEGSQNPNTIASDNPFAGMKLYFHRQDAPSASSREYWGYWSLNSDPERETGLEGCEDDIKLEVTTLPMGNELDKEIRRREEERLAGIPGGWN